MKIRFTEKCLDKNTGVEYQTDCEYIFDDDRAREILATGYAEVVEGNPVPKTDASEGEKDLVPSNLTVAERLDSGEMVNLYELSKAELVELAKNEGVSTKGTKEELIARLLGD